MDDGMGTLVKHVVRVSVSVGHSRPGLFSVMGTDPASERWGYSGLFCHMKLSGGQP